MVGGVGVKITRVAADLLLLVSKRKADEGIAAGGMVFKIGRFVMEMAMVQIHTNIQKHDLGGGGVPGSNGGIMAVEAFKELGKGIMAIGGKCR